MKTTTFNVLEGVNGKLENLVTFDNTIEGLNSAEKLFIELGIKNGMEKENANYYLEDREYSKEGYHLHLIKL